MTDCLEARSAVPPTVPTSWSEPVFSVSGYCSMSLVSVPFWHVRGTLHGSHKVLLMTSLEDRLWATWRDVLVRMHWS